MSNDKRETEREGRMEASGTRFPVQRIWCSRSGRRMNGIVGLLPTPRQGIRRVRQAGRVWRKETEYRKNSLTDFFAGLDTPINKKATGNFSSFFIASNSYYLSRGPVFFFSFGGAISRFCASCGLILSLTVSL